MSARPKITPEILAARRQEFDAAFSAAYQEAEAAREHDPQISLRTETCRRLRDQGWSLDSIGLKFGVTRERIRQILKASQA
jgi:DNA-directed RNA polymerase sigma subunit (sigma70/sigma32)